MKKQSEVKRIAAEEQFKADNLASVQA